MAAVFTTMGDDQAKRLLENIKRNDVKISTSNGESADLASSGEFGFSLVDSDDAFSRIKQGRPIEITYPDQSVAGLGCMIIPNAVVLIKGGPNPENAKRLIDYLLSKETERKLAFSDAAQFRFIAEWIRRHWFRASRSSRQCRSTTPTWRGKMQDIQSYLKNLGGSVKMEVRCEGTVWFS